MWQCKKQHKKCTLVIKSWQHRAVTHDITTLMSAAVGWQFHLNFVFFLLERLSKSSPHRHYRKYYGELSAKLVLLPIIKAKHTASEKNKYPWYTVATWGWGCCSTLKTPTCTYKRTYGWGPGPAAPVMHGTSTVFRENFTRHSLCTRADPLLITQVMSSQVLLSAGFSV